MNAEQSGPQKLRKEDELDIEGLRSGDPAALEQFFRRYGDRVFHIAFRMCGNREEAQDTSQQALMLAMRKFHQFRGDSRLITWLYQILFHECMRSKRIESRYKTMVNIHFPEPFLEPDRFDLPKHLVGDVFEPEQYSLLKEQRELFWQAVSELSTRLRKVFLLRDIEGLSTRETANALSLSETNVKVRLHRARKRIGAILKERLAVREGST